MELTTIIVTTLLNNFATSPDLCAEVYIDSTGNPYMDSVGRTLSRYCQWSGPDVPVWDDQVCCDVDGNGGECWLAERDGSCAGGAPYYCEYGELVGAGDFTCYQPFPSACDHGNCVDAPELPPDVQADLMCCSSGMCQEIVPAQIFECDENGGLFQWCQDGMSNADGSITCFD